MNDLLKLFRTLTNGVLLMTPEIQALHDESIRLGNIFRDLYAANDDRALSALDDFIDARRLIPRSDVSGARPGAYAAFESCQMSIG